MIESRYSIEYVETDAHQQKSFSLLKYIIALLLVAGLGLFAYSTITGTPIERLLNQPVSFVKDSFLKATKPSPIVENKAVESSLVNDAENNLENSVANTEIEAELRNTIDALEEKLQMLTAEKDQITQSYTDLLKEKKLLEQTTTEQLTDNKTLQENLQRIKEKLAAANKDNLKLSEQIAIQQVENDTLSSLLESSKKEKEAKKEVVAISKPETPATNTILKEETKAVDSDKQVVADDEGSKQAKTELASTTTEPSKPSASPEPIQEAVISSDVDAIVKAMQGAKK